MDSISQKVFECFKKLWEWAEGQPEYHKELEQLEREEAVMQEILKILKENPDGSPFIQSTTLGSHSILNYTEYRYGFSPEFAWKRYIEDIEIELEVIQERICHKKKLEEYLEIAKHKLEECDLS